MSLNIGTLLSASQELSSVPFLLPLRPSGANDPSSLPHRDPHGLAFSAPPRLVTQTKGH